MKTSKDIVALIYTVLFISMMSTTLLSAAAYE